MIQKEILKSEELLKTALVNMGAMMFAYDVQKKSLVVEGEQSFCFEKFPNASFEQSYIHPLDVAILRECVANLEQGKNIDDTDIRCHKSKDKEFTWYRVHLLKTEKTDNNFIIYGSLSNVSKEHALFETTVAIDENVFSKDVGLERRILQYVCGKTFYMLVVIDGNTGEAKEWLNHPTKRDGRFIHIDDIDVNSIKYFKKMATAENFDRIVEKTRLKNILSELETNDKYAVFFEGTSAKGVTSYFRAEFSYIDREAKLICYTCADVSTMVAKSMEQKEAVRQTIELSMAAQNAKNSFFANMSHEIRTPLNAIVGMAEIAKLDCRNPKKVKECMDIMLTFSQNLVRVISNILDTSSVQSGTITLEPKETRIMDLVEKVKKEFAETVKKPNQEFTVECKLQHEYALLDENRALRVFNNVLENAANFSQDKGKIKLTVEELPGKQPDEGILKIQISDNGKGISKEDLNHVFEPFYRDRDSSTNYLSGTGLGLSVVKNILDAKGATIEIDSELNKGTVVTIMNPVKFPREIKKKNAPKTVLEGRRVLVVEDQPINMLVAKRMLEKFGATVDTAEHGRFAVEQYLSQPEGTYDLIFMDIQMPIMNGYEATKKIRSSGRGDSETIKIVSMTANVLPEDIKQSKEAGMDAHIGKPIRTEDLSQMIVGLLNRE